MNNDEEKKIDKKERVKDVCIAILSVVLIVYLAMGINSMAHGDKMGFYNLRFYIMSSNSADENTNVSDLVVAKKIKKEKVKENDNIIYRKNNKLNVKKVITYIGRDGETALYYENGNGNITDKVSDFEVAGKVLFTIKGFGNLALFIKSPIGVLNLIVLVLCIFIIIKKINRNKQTCEEDEGRGTV